MSLLSKILRRKILQLYWNGDLFEISQHSPEKETLPLSTLINSAPKTSEQPLAQGQEQLWPGQEISISRIRIDIFA